MSSHRFTPQARADLEDIADYIQAQSSPDRAETVVRALFDAAAKLAEMPGMGHVREDLTDEDVRFWTVKSYHLVYRPETRPLEVVAILSGWRDVKTELRRRF